MSAPKRINVPCISEAQRDALEAAKALRDALLFHPLTSGHQPMVPAEGVNPALPHGTDAGAGFGFTFGEHRFYVAIDRLED